MSIDVTSDASARSRDARTARSNGQRSSQERPPPPRSDQHESMSRSRASGTRAGGMGRRARRRPGGARCSAEKYIGRRTSMTSRGKRRAQSVLYCTGIMHPPVSFYRIMHRMFERT